MRVLPLILFFCLFITSNLCSQTDIDNLIELNKTLNDDDTAKISVLHKLSWLMKAEKPEKAVEYGKQALKLAQQSENINLEAKSLKNIATAYWFAGKNRKAERYFKIAIEKFEKVNNLSGKSSCFNNLGLTLESRGNNLEASEAYKESLKIDRKIKNKKGEATSLSNLGNILNKEGNFGEAINHYMQALKIRYEINDLRGIATIYNNIGVIYEKQDNYEDAIRNYEEALEVYKEINDERYASLAMNNIGYSLYQQDKYEQALKYFKQTIKTRLKIDDKKGLATTYLNMANLYLDYKMYDEALECLNKSKEYSTIIGNKYEISKVTLIQAKYYLNKKKYSEVIKLLKTVDYQNNVLLENQPYLLEMLGNAYFETSKYKDACITQQEYFKLNDSLNKRNNEDRIVKMQMKYEFAKKQNEIEIEKKKQELLHEQEIMEQKSFGRVLLAVLFTVIIAGIFIYRSYILKKKDNKELQFHKNQNDIINKELVKYQDKLIREKLLIKQNDQIIKELNQYSEAIKSIMKYDESSLANILKSYFVINTSLQNIFITKKRDEFIFILFGNGVVNKNSYYLINTLTNLILDKTLENIYDQPNCEVLKEINNTIYPIWNGIKRKEKVNKWLNVGLCIIDTKLNELHFMGANSSLIVSKDNDINEFKRDKISLGVEHIENFKLNIHKIKLCKNDKLFLLATKETDENSSSNDHDLVLNNFKELLLKNKNCKMTDIEKNILNNIESWHHFNRPINEIAILGFSDIL